MTSKLPSTLGAAVVPQPGGVSRIAQVDSRGLNAGLIDSANLQGNAWHKTAAGLQDVGQAYDKLQLDQDQKEAKDALTTLLNQKTKLLYGDGTAQNPGYYNLKGDAAVAGAKQASEQLGKLRTDLLGKTSNKQVTKLFDAASTDVIQPDVEGILAHASKEHQVALQATDQASLDGWTNTLAANPTNQTVQAQARTGITGAVISMLKREGITDPDVINEKVKDANSKALVAGVRTALFRNTSDGLALYAKFKDGIQGTDQTALEVDIQQKQNADRVKSEHDVYMKDYYDRKHAQDAQDSYANAIVNHWADPDKNPLPDLNALAADPNMHSGQKMEILNAIQAADKPEASSKVSSRTLSQLLPRILLKPGSAGKISDYSEITQALGKGILNKADFGFAMSMIDQGKTEDGQKLLPRLEDTLKAATQVIAHPSAAGIISDDNASLKLNEWTAHMRDKVEEYKKANKDPQALFDPHNKTEYLLSPQNLQPYLLSLDQRMNDLKSSMSGESDESQVLPGMPTGEQQEEATAPKSVKIEDANKLPYPIFTSPDDQQLTNLPTNSPYYRPDGNGNYVLRYKQPKSTETKPAAPAAPSGL